MGETKSPMTAFFNAPLCRPEQNIFELNFWN